MIGVTVTTDKPFRLIPALRQQLPYVEAKAINATALNVQTVETAHIFHVFQVRNRTFAKRATKIRQFANKRQPTIQAEVAIDPPGNRADVFAKFESGGQKTPRGSSLAVPDPTLRGARGAVPKSKRPKAFGFQYAGQGPKATVFRGRRGTFLIKTGPRTGLLLQRKDGQVKVLYRLIPRARIDDRLAFLENAKETIERQYPGNFRKALDRALRTAR